MKQLIETCITTLGYTPYKVQIEGAKALNDGKLIEMNTGEGKTLTAIFPAALHALKGEKVHILTFNDYLAERDANWMKPFYSALGLSVGWITSKLSADQRRQAYRCDILYATAKEVGFDYLKSFIAYDPEEIILPKLDFAIVDEADAILIDEARNPLILAGDMAQETPDLRQISEIVSRLRKNHDYSMDEYDRNIFLNDPGIQVIEHSLGIDNLYNSEYQQILSAVNLSLQAHYLLDKDKDYIVRNQQIFLVDEFTGRIVKDRKWQYGLQMAVEVKEGLQPRDEGMMLGRLTLPDFLGMYKSLAAMTATAAEAKDEFKELYKLEIVKIPPNLECIRKDLKDQVFSHKEAKDKALVEEISRLHQTGQPILVGTLTVQESEALADKLRAFGLNPKVLNAHNDAEEAEIIADAGDLYALTISTNMAGRGTDIILGGKSGRNREAVVHLGGLHVIGTNRHESRRIDNQLRGRAGRQGDPGSSQFFISMEDDLMLKYNLQKLLPKKLRGIRYKGAFTNKTIEARIAQAQRIIEGQMQDLRSNLADYSRVLEGQRKIYQADRMTWLYTNYTYKDHIINQYDQNWAVFLDFAHELKEGIYLLRLGGEDPLVKYNKFIDKRFKDLLLETEEAIREIREHPEKSEKFPLKKPGSTWNYVVNDNPFQNKLAIKLLSVAMMGSART